MRRWNGWGDEAIAYPLAESAAHYLATIIGEATPRPDASFKTVVDSVPDSRLPDHPLISTDAAERVRHARGQSLPDWIALRSGRIDSFPDGVARPTSDEEIRTLLRFARQIGSCVIPYGGGTSVVGHINPRPGDPPVITLDLRRLSRLKELDEASRLATFEAGVCGPDLEAQLRPRGFTLGHFPQSFEYSTLGGWVATRSKGQQSYYYGRVEDLFAGGHLETPLGPWDLPPHPASAAGPDLRHLVLGSEGRLGVITRATIRVRPLPETERFYGAVFQDWEAGVSAVRAAAQSAVPVSMLRLSDAQETQTSLALSGRAGLISWADRGLRLLGYGPERCLLVFGITGDHQRARTARRWIGAVVRAHGGRLLGAGVGKMWGVTRFRAPYLRNTLWERGYALDTLETAVPWSGVLPTARAMKAAIRDGLADEGERVLAFAHLSHVYPDGASIYVTFLYRRGTAPEETLSRWATLKGAASQAILAHGGTISHQHGVGVDHVPYLSAEKGKIGMSLLESTQRALDPDGILNPGKLLMGS